MEISAEDIDGNIRCIRLDGRFDSEGSQSIETKFAAYMSLDNGKIVIDMSDVIFLASIGIRTLIVNAKSLQKRGGKAALFAPTYEVERVLKMVGIAALIPVCADLDAAKAAVLA